MNAIRFLLAIIGTAVCVHAQRGDIGYIEEDEPIIPLPEIDDPWRGDAPSWEMGAGPVVGAATFGEIHPIHYPEIREDFKQPFGYINHFGSGRPCKVLKGYGGSGGYHHQVYQSFGQGYHEYPTYDHSVNFYPTQAASIQSVSYQPKLHTYPGASSLGGQNYPAYQDSASVTSYPSYTPTAAGVPSFGQASSLSSPVYSPSSNGVPSFGQVNSLSQPVYPQTSNGVASFGQASLSSNPIYTPTSNGVASFGQASSISQPVYLPQSSIAQSFEHAHVNGGDFSGAQNGMFFPGSDNSYQ